MSINEIFLILLGTIFVNNIVLAQLLGVCQLIGITNKLETAVGVGAATILVMTFASMGSYALNQWILVPLEIEYLRTLTFILTIAIIVQGITVFSKKTNSALYPLFNLFMPLITVNCAVLGAALLNIQKSHNFFESTVYGFGSGVGFAIVLIVFSTMRERLAFADVPQPFKGAPIQLITAGLLSLAFMGFSGLTSL